MGFFDVWWQKILSGMVFLLIFLVALIGNLLTIILPTFDQLLQTPMYFFLKQLSVLHICYIFIILPKATVDNLTNSSSISLWGWILEVFFVVSLACIEMALLMVMSYDHYVAICHPLHYEVIMKKSSCLKMTTYPWFSGGVSGILHTATTFSLPLRASNLVHQFFCEIPQLLRLSCSEEYFVEVGAVITSSLSFVCFVFVVLSYIHNFSTGLKIPSTTGQSKVFSISIPHLVVVTFFLSAAAEEYLKPSTDVPTVCDLLVSVFYTIVPPILNPIIYSLRNKDIKDAVKRYLKITYLDSVTC